MEFDKLVAVSGKPGLYKIVSQGKGTVIAQSLIDGKRLSLAQSQKVSTLSDIAIYTTGEEKPLREVFQAMHVAYAGKPIDADLSNTQDLETVMDHVLPEYDRDRVYNSDIKKLIKWYNLLLNSGMTFEAAKEVRPEDEQVDRPEADSAAESPNS